MFNRQVRMIDLEKIDFTRIEQQVLDDGSDRLVVWIMANASL